MPPWLLFVDYTIKTTLLIPTSHGSEETFYVCGTLLLSNSHGIYFKKYFFYKVDGF